MTRGFKSDDRNGIRSRFLGFHCMPHARCFVHDLDTGIVVGLDEPSRVGTRGLDHSDAGIDDHLLILLIGRRIDRRQGREVHGDRPIRQVTRPTKFLSECIRGGKRERRDGSQAAGIAHSGCKTSFPDPLHTPPA